MSEHILQRELLQARQRADVYRKRLEHAAHLTRRFHAHATSLRELLDGDAGTSRAEPILRDIAILSGKALEVSRSSIWLFDDDRRHLVRACEIVDGVDVDGPPLTIADDSCKAYIAAFTAGAVVAVEDVTGDPRMAGLEDYLRKNDVRAILDIAIAVPGGVSGVVCHEHLGGSRK